ncbi:hypothetical protein [Luteimicrobium subarcticum]|uniref:Uncharacterized protein n=1 Tax=Luteimicrobium subarcticum TaxID=620910 RepID=A0A2M8WRW9_9MICO|nr:hypothetical protein [Luteimicrobium subarcticum]PJI93690.1 hypothetical protein CLV34_1164 [Luteimicrobium subarcticum]
MTPPTGFDRDLHLPSPGAVVGAVVGATPGALLVRGVAEPVTAELAAHLLRSAREHLAAAVAHAHRALDVEWVSRAATAYGVDVAATVTAAAVVDGTLAGALACADGGAS